MDKELFREFIKTKMTVDIATQSLMETDLTKLMAMLDDVEVHLKAKGGLAPEIREKAIKNLEYDREVYLSAMNLQDICKARFEFLKTLPATPPVPEAKT